MNFNGIIVGAAVFMIIGICHPIVIKMEYYWGKRCWWVLLLGHPRDPFAGDACHPGLVPGESQAARLLRAQA